MAKQRQNRQARNAKTSPKKMKVKNEKDLSKLPGAINWNSGEKHWKKMKKKLRLPKGIYWNTLASDA
jgi:hypothetical protein